MKKWTYFYCWVPKYGRLTYLGKCEATVAQVNKNFKNTSVTEQEYSRVVHIHKT